MVQTILLQPAVVFIFFLMLVSGIYFSTGRAASDGDVHHSRHKTYTGGEEVNPPEGQVHYQAFFWMALLFGILHMGALVLSTLPLESMPYRLAFLYLLGAGAGVFVLTEEEF